MLSYANVQNTRYSMYMDIETDTYVFISNYYFIAVAKCGLLQELWSFHGECLFPLLVEYNSLNG